MPRADPLARHRFPSQHQIPACLPGPMATGCVRSVDGAFQRKRRQRNRRTLHTLLSALRIECAGIVNKRLPTCIGRALLSGASEDAGGRIQMIGPSTGTPTARLAPATEGAGAGAGFAELYNDLLVTEVSTSAGCVREHARSYGALRDSRGRLGSRGKLRWSIPFLPQYGREGKEE